MSPRELLLHEMKWAMQDIAPDELTDDELTRIVMVMRDARRRIFPANVVHLKGRPRAAVRKGRGRARV